MDLSKFPQPFIFVGSRRSLDELPKPDNSPRNLNPWALIHRWVVDNSFFWSPEKAQAYYQSWLLRIPIHLPNGATCGCQSHWQELSKEFPPDFGSAQAFERWLYDRHDDVSRIHSGARRISFEHSQKIWRGPRVGVLHTCFNRIGGTETFVRTLLPELRHHVDVVGFHATECTGDVESLKVPYFPDRKMLVDQCDTIIAWGITGLEDCSGKRVISVHHADTGSDWSDNLQLHPEITDVVCVHPDVPSHLAKLTDRPAVYIPNPLASPKLSGKDPTKDSGAHDVESVAIQWRKLLVGQFDR